MIVVSSDCMVWKMLSCHFGACGTLGKWHGRQLSLHFTDSMACIPPRLPRSLCPFPPPPLLCQWFTSGTVGFNGSHTISFLTFVLGIKDSSGVWPPYSTTYCILVSPILLFLLLDTYKCKPNIICHFL